MTNPAKKDLSMAKAAASFGAQVRIIRAMVWDDAQAARVLASFPVSDVTAVLRKAGTGEGIVQLRSGLRIVTQMDGNVLEQKIFAPTLRDPAVIDLSSLTAGFDMTVATVRVAARKDGGKETKVVDIRLADIDLDNVEEISTDNSAIRYSTILHFKDGSQQDPFGKATLRFDIRRDDFNRAITGMRQKGVNHVSLVAGMIQFLHNGFTP